MCISAATTLVTKTQQMQKLCFPSFNNGNDIHSPLSFATATPTLEVIATRCLIINPIKHRIVKVDNIDMVEGTEITATGAEAVSLLVHLGGGIPLQTVLPDVDVLARLHFLDDVLGITDARESSAPGADFRGVAAGKASVGFDTMGNDICHGDERRVGTAHHETILNDKASRLRHIFVCGWSNSKSPAGAMIYMNIHMI